MNSEDPGVDDRSDPATEEDGAGDAARDQHPKTGPGPDAGDANDPYVHDPSVFEDATATESGETGRPAAKTPSAPDDEGLGRRGWALLAAVVLAFFGAPAFVLLQPPGVPFEVALLVVPLGPAFLLGAAAVWAMAGREEA